METDTQVAEAESANPSPQGDATFKVLGVRVHAVQIPGVVAQMASWITARDGCHFIAVTGMHGVSEAQRDPYFKKILKRRTWWCRTVCLSCGSATGTDTPCSAAFTGQAHGDVLRLHWFSVSPFPLRRAQGVPELLGWGPAGALRNQCGGRILAALSRTHAGRG